MTVGLRALRRRLSLLAAALLIALPLLMSGCDRLPLASADGAEVAEPAGASGSASSGATAGAPEPVLAVRTAAVRQGDLRHELAYVGTVRPRRQVKVAARVGGTVAVQRAEEGDEVKAGDVLVQITAPELEAKAATVRAELARVRALEGQACRVARTDRRLALTGALPTARADASAAQCKSAREAVRAVSGKQRELGISLGRRYAKAPVAGRVLRWLVEPGETVGPGRPLALLAVGAGELEIQATDTDVARGIRPDTTVRLLLPGQGGQPRAHTTRVVRVAPMAMGPLRHVAVRAALPPALAHATPGTAIDARLLLATTKAATTVPLRAVVRGPGDEAAVFVARADKGPGRDARAERRAVTLGLRAGDQVAITPPLPAGSRVVTSNLASLRAGQALFTVAERAVSALEVQR